MDLFLHSYWPVSDVLLLLQVAVVNMLSVPLEVRFDIPFMISPKVGTSYSRKKGELRFANIQIVAH